MVSSQPKHSKVAESLPSQVLCCYLLSAGLIISDLSTSVRLRAEMPVTPLPQAHAHNDYEHPRPLLDALEAGFTSIEADVYLVDGRLLVAHDLKDVAPERTLEALYLRPLQERVRAHGGWVSPTAERYGCWSTSSRQAERYAELGSCWPGTQTCSGNQRRPAHRAGSYGRDRGDRPIDAIAASNPRYAGIDGRLGDLDSDLPASLMPLISDNWRIHFRARRSEAFSQENRQKLRSIVSRAHQHGRRVRFWATPESEELWQELLDAGVDLIGTDDLQRLSTFLQKSTAAEGLDAR